MHCEGWWRERSATAIHAWKTVVDSVENDEGLATSHVGEETALSDIAMYM